MQGRIRRNTCEIELGNTLYTHDPVRAVALLTNWYRELGEDPEYKIDVQQHKSTANVLP
jgi:hypothetical protein